MGTVKVIFFILFGITHNALALENGLALTPPMGWLTWQRFRCITDCKKYPDECISENLIKRTADLLVKDGYKDAGYEYIAIDDCWLEHNRSSDGRMVPDRERFPSGMKALSDYVHSLGLKFGMYQDIGTKTCGGYPGDFGYEELDVQTFVEWGIDYLKLDGCYYNVDDMDTGYPKYGELLAKSGRPILYSCSWPAYQEENDNITVDYASIAKHCNLWRNYDDIDDSWNSMKGIMTWFGKNQDRFTHHSGPGKWNDPDMLLIGNFGLSVDQARVQMAVWAVLAAPLLMSVDLAKIRPEFKEILLNHEIIGVNQDSLGKQGVIVSNDKENFARNIDVWKRELNDGSFALAFVNRNEDGAPRAAKYSFEQLTIPAQAYDIKDLYKDEEDKLINRDEKFEVRINPTGVKFYKFIPNDQGSEDRKIEKGVKKIPDAILSNKLS